MAGVNLKTLDLNLLVVFEAIYSAGNISRAANQLAMSQPAVSNALARLRDLVGDQLFVRAKRGVEPTGKAEEMIGPVREALALIRRQLGGGDEIDLAVVRRRFRILMIDALEPILMPPVIRILTEQAPSIQIEGITYRADFVEALKAGTLDLAFFVYPISDPDIMVVPICPIDVVIIARRNHGAIGTTLDVATFASLRQMALVPELRPLNNVDRDLAANRMPRDIAYAVSRLGAIPAMIERTDLIAPLPRRFAEEMSKNFDIAIHEAPVRMTEQHMYMLWGTKNNGDAAHRWLRETFLSAIPRADSVPDADVSRAGMRARPASSAGRPTDRSSA